MYKHILIATDGSDPAARAVAHGIALAKVHQAKVTVITVTERWSAFVLGLASQYGHRNPLGDYESAAAAEAKSILEAAGRLATSEGVTCELVHVPDQSPADGILATVQGKNCDLIIMGSHGRRGVDRALVGSRVHEVLTRCKVPILVVR